jgi:hypothetical protein
MDHGSLIGGWNPKDGGCASSNFVCGVAGVSCVMLSLMFVLSLLSFIVRFTSGTVLFVNNNFWERKFELR